jgi:hypothetical protein
MMAHSIDGFAVMPKSVIGARNTRCMNHMSTSARAWSLQMPDVSLPKGSWYNEVGNPTARRIVYCDEYVIVPTRSLCAYSQSHMSASFLTSLHFTFTSIPCNAMQLLKTSSGPTEFRFATVGSNWPNLYDPIDSSSETDIAAPGPKRRLSYMNPIRRARQWIQRRP